MSNCIFIFVEPVVFFFGYRYLFYLKYFFKVASRAVFLTAGIILVVSGVVGKFGAVLTLIPDPVVGGVLTVLCGMIMGSGLSMLKFVELDSTRNLSVIGTSLMVALTMTEVFKDPEMAAKFKTGIY